MVLEILKWAGITVGLIGGVIVLLRTVFAVNKWIIHVNAHTDSAEEIKGKIDDLQTTLERKIDRVMNIAVLAFVRSRNEPVVETKSPPRLAKFGKEISSELKLESVAQGLARELAQQIIDKEDYEIHEFSANFARGEYIPSSQDDENFKKYSFSKGVPREIILEVLAIELRDKLLQLKRANST